MRTRNSLAVFLCIGLSQLAGAADHRASIRTATEGPRATIESPIVGYFSSSTGLVAIEGISSAAHARSLAPIAADRVVLPPGQMYQWQERDGRVYLAQLPPSRASEVISDAWSGADIIAFNSSASAAVLDRAGRLQVISGLTSSPLGVRQIAAPQGAGDVTALAISDDSTVVLAATSTGVYAASGDGDWRLVTAGSASAMAFVPQSHDAILARTGGIYLVKDAVSAQWLSDADSPIAIAASDDGRLAVVLNAAGREALVIYLQTAAVTSLPLGAAAKDLQRGRDGTLIFIPAQGISPWLLDTKSGALSFAPELPDLAQGR